MTDAKLQHEVKELIPDNEERSKLFEALKRYQSNQELHRLLGDLRKLLNEPNKLEIYDLMRPLISVKHQIDYSLRSPVVPGVKLRVVRLQRRTSESLGFSVRGGFEHGVGVFVTDVVPGSQGDRQGLRVGDEIVRVNGFTISEAIHDDVLNLIKSRDDIILKVTYIGMVPINEEATDTVTWKYVGKNMLESDGDEQILPCRESHSDIRIFVDTTGYNSLGCTIKSDSTVVPGIFVEKVRVGTLAEEVGLEPGDQLVDVNDTSFWNLTHEQAVLALKSSRQLNMTIRKGVGLEYFRNPMTANLVHVNPAEKPPMETVEVPPGPPMSTAPTLSPPQSPKEEKGLEGRSYTTEPILDEVMMIQQQLNMKSASKWMSSTIAPVPQLSSPSLSGESTSPVMSVSVDMHVTSEGDSVSSRARRDFGASWTGSKVSSLGGAAAMLEERRMHPSGAPDFLGPPQEIEWSDNVPPKTYARFNADVLEGRMLKSLTFKKAADLGIEIEGGLGSPLGGKIVVAVVFEDGVAHRSGKIHIGDQLMMVNGQTLLDMTVAGAERMLHDVSTSTSASVELIYCESTIFNDEDSVTYF